MISCTTVHIELENLEYFSNFWDILFDAVLTNEYISKLWFTSSLVGFQQSCSPFFRWTEPLGGCEISFTVIDIIYIDGTRCIYDDRRQKTRHHFHLLLSRMHPLSLYFMLPPFLILGPILALPSTFYLNSLVFSFSFYLYFTIISFWIRIRSLCWISSILCGKNAVLYSSFPVMPRIYVQNSVYERVSFVLTSCVHFECKDVHVCGDGNSGDGGNDTDYALCQVLGLTLINIYISANLHARYCHRENMCVNGRSVLVWMRTDGQINWLTGWLAGWLTDWQDLWHTQQLGMICVMVKTCRKNTDQRPNDCAQFYYCMRQCVLHPIPKHTHVRFLSFFLCRFIYAERLALHS